METLSTPACSALPKSSAFCGELLSHPNVSPLPLSSGPPHSPFGVIHSWQFREVSGQPLGLNFQGLYLGPSILGSFQNSPQSGGSASVLSVQLEGTRRLPESLGHLKAQPSLGKGLADRLHSAVSGNDRRSRGIFYPPVPREYVRFFPEILGRLEAPPPPSCTSPARMRSAISAGGGPGCSEPRRRWRRRGSRGCGDGGRGGATGRARLGVTATSAAVAAATR